MRVKFAVVDTNVLISALLNRQGKARKALDVIRRDGFIVFSDETFNELATRLKRPKFDSYISADLRTEYLHTLIDMSEWVPIQGEPLGCRDKDDDKFLETAMVGEVDVLLSGDKDLLVMRQINSIPIMSITDFLAAYL